MDRKQYQQELEEGEKWATLSGKTIDLQQLLRWGISNATAKEDTTKPSQVSTEPLDPKWLDVIMGKSDMQRMKECMEKVLDKDVTVSVHDKVTALDELELLVEDIDNAKDFVQTNLWRLLLPFTQHPDEPLLRTHALWVLGTMVQNNPVIKKAYLNNEMLPRLLSILREEPDTSALSKVVYCLSGYLKHNEPGQQELLERNGLVPIADRLFSKDTDDTVKRKLLFMLSSLLEDDVVQGLPKRIQDVRPAVRKDLEALRHDWEAELDLCEMVDQCLKHF